MAKNIQMRRERVDSNGSSSNGILRQNNSVADRNVKLCVFSSVIGRMESTGRHDAAFALCLEIHNMQRAIKNLAHVSISAAEKFAMQHDLHIELAREFEHMDRHEDALKLYLECGKTERALEIAVKLERFDLASDICASSGDEIRAHAYKEISTVLKKNKNV